MEKYTWTFYYCLLFLCASASSITLMENCYVCTTTLNSSFYQIWWYSSLVPDYICREGKLDHVAKMGHVTQKICSSEECRSVEDLIPGMNSILEYDCNNNSIPHTFEIIPGHHEMQGILYAVGFIAFLGFLALLIAIYSLIQQHAGKCGKVIKVLGCILPFVHRERRSTRREPVMLYSF